MTDFAPWVYQDEAKQRGVPPEGMALLSGYVATADGSDPGDTHVLIDGDTTSIPALSLMGAVNEGHRVMVLFWPPHGAYIIGGNFGHAWHPFPFAAGWADLGGANQPCEYRLDRNTIKLRGFATRVSGVTTLIGTLPVGYRPQYQENFAVDATGNQHSAIAVAANGDVSWGQGAAASPAYVSLSGVDFDAYDFT